MKIYGKEGWVEVSSVSREIRRLLIRAECDGHLSVTKFEGKEYTRLNPYRWGN